MHEPDLLVPVLADGAGDTAARAERFFRAFKTLPERELFAALADLRGEEHIWACEAKCLAGPTPAGGCLHPKKTFLSTRNSRRSAHVFLFYFYLFGDSAHISDEMLKDTRRLLRPTCSFGLNECNGHARARAGQVCINPFHYLVIEPSQILSLLASEGLITPQPLRDRNIPARTFCEDIRRAVAVGEITSLPGVFAGLNAVDSFASPAFSSEMASSPVRPSPYSSQSSSMYSPYSPQSAIDSPAHRSHIARDAHPLDGHVAQSNLLARDSHQFHLARPARPRVYTRRPFLFKPEPADPGVDLGDVDDQADRQPVSHDMDHDSGSERSEHDEAPALPPYYLPYGYHPYYAALMAMGWPGMQLAHAYAPPVPLERPLSDRPSRPESDQDGLAMLAQLASERERMAA
eukprot:m.45193 g.45193  ORF g.45193 m.45193 type:complete len:404 (+) comp5864_c0_seq1:74-1285(+)